MISAEAPLAAAGLRTNRHSRSAALSLDSSLKGSKLGSVQFSSVQFNSVQSYRRSHSEPPLPSCSESVVVLSSASSLLYRFARSSRAADITARTIAAVSGEEPSAQQLSAVGMHGWITRTADSDGTSSHDSSFCVPLSAAPCIHTYYFIHRPLTLPHSTSAIPSPAVVASLSAELAAVS